MSNKKIECEIVRKGFTVKGDELPVGTRIKLSQKAVDSFVGKVTPVKELDTAEAAKIVSLKSIGGMKDEIAAANIAIGKLEDANDDLAEKLAEANGKVAHLEEVAAKLKAAEKKG